MSEDQVDLRKVAVIVATIFLLAGALAVTDWIRPLSSGEDTLDPTGDGTYHNLYPQLTTNWEKVSDDNDATQVYTSDANDDYYTDLYQTEDFNLPSGNIIDNVTFYIRVKSQSSARKSTWYIKIKTSAEYEQLAGTPGNQWTLYSWPLTTNPNGSAWTESAVNAMEIGEKGKSYDFFGLIYRGYCTQTYAVVSYSSLKPQYSDLGKSSNVTARENCDFYCNWSSAAGLSHYIFEHNNTGTLTNYTYSFSSGTWSNKTLLLNETGDCIIQHRFGANDTSDEWNWTSVQTFYCWLPLPNVLERNLGKTIGGSHWSGAIYYNGTSGGVAAIYTCYSNSSCLDPVHSHWMHQVAAFNLNTEVWTDVFNISESGGTNTHWNPAVSVLPDGRLIVLYGYNTPLKYRISTYNATTESNLTKLITNWGSQQTFSTSIGYPMPLRWDDRLIVVARQGGSISGNFTYCEWNGTAFENMTTLVVFSEYQCSLYAYVQKVGNKVLMGYSKRDFPENFTGVYCIYSDDKGKNWKNWNGTSLSTPIDGNQGLAVNSAHLTQAYAPVIDEDNHLLLWTLKDGYPKLAQYNQSIGTSGGSWTHANITYANGTQIKGYRYGVQYQDPYYERPSGWGSIGTENGEGNRICKIVRLPGETHKFHIVWKKSDAEHVYAGAAHYFTNVVDCPEAYEALILEEYYSVFNVTLMPDVVEPTGNYLFGVKYTCALTGTLTGVKLWWNKTDADVEKYRCYIYNTTLYRLAVGVWAEHDYDAGNHTGWGDVSSLTCEVVKDTAYFVCFVFYAPEDVNFRMDDGASNQYFNVSITPGQHPPLQLSGVTYDSKKFMIKAIISNLVVHGIGRKFPTLFSTGWNHVYFWQTDVGHTLGEINASVWSDSIVFSVFTLEFVNGTQVSFWRDSVANAAVEVESQNDDFWVYCTTGGQWNHEY